MPVFFCCAPFSSRIFFCWILRGVWVSLGSDATEIADTTLQDFCCPRVERCRRPLPCWAFFGVSTLPGEFRLALDRRRHRETGSGWLSCFHRRRCDAGFMYYNALSLPSGREYSHLRV